MLAAENAPTLKKKTTKTPRRRPKLKTRGRARKPVKIKTRGRERKVAKKGEVQTVGQTSTKYFKYHTPYSAEWIKFGTEHDHDYFNKHEPVRLWTALQDHTYYTVDNYVCEICGRKSINPKTYRLHQLCHLEAKVTWFKCKTCDFRSTCDADVVNHVCQEKLHVNVIGQLLKCSKCDFKCTSVLDLVQHKTAEHFKESLVWHNKNTFCDSRCKVCKDVIEDVVKDKL